MPVESDQSEFDAAGGSLDPMATLPVSVIIPTFNGGDRLLAVLESLRCSVPGPAEIIVADDASTDDSIDRLKRDHPGVRVVRVGESASGPSAARNAGAALATQDILAFVDADVRVHPDTLSLLVRPILSEPGVVATFGSYDDTPEADGTASIYGNLRHHVVHQASPESAETFWSGLGAARRATFAEVGGFDTTFGEPSIEDVELGTRLRASGEIRVVAAAQATHLKRWTIGSLWKTDIFKRAMPWGRLAVDRPLLGTALNASFRERISAGLVALVVSALALTTWLAGQTGGWVAGAIVLTPAVAWCAINRVLLGALWRRGGPRVALGGGLLHAAYYVYAPASYLLSLMWHRWHRSLSDRLVARWFLVACALSVLGLVFAGLLLMLIGVADTAYLLERLLAAERDAASPRYNMTTLAGAQHRLLAIGLASALTAGVLALLGPFRLRSVAGQGLASVRELFGMPRSHWLIAAVLSVTYMAMGAGCLDQQMRLDEAASFSMFAGGSPFVALATYDTPNNHMLNSALMWASVNLFGPTEWSARLPAFLAAQLIPVCMLMMSRRLISAEVGVLATSLFVTSTIAIDIATNARGYPFVIVSMLLLLGLLPSLWARRPGAGIAAAVIGAVGIFACPVMAYPLSVVYVAWFIGGIARGRGQGLDVAKRVAATGLGTLALAAVGYAPAWALRTGQSPVAVIDRTARIMTEDEALIQFDQLGYNLSAAWDQWTAPLSGPAAIVLLAASVAGLVMWLTARGSPRLLAAGLLIGPIGVFALGRFASPPWWILVWCVPIVAMLIATPIERIVHALTARKISAGVATVVLSGLTVCVGLLIVTSSRYPNEFPHRTGMRDAPAVVESLVDEGIEDAQVLTLSHWYRLMNFEFEKRGLRRGISVPAEWVSEPTRSQIVYVRAAEDTRWDRYNFIGEELLTRLRLVRSERIGVAVVDRYDVIKAPSAEEGSVEFESTP